MTMSLRDELDEIRRGLRSDRRRRAAIEFREIRRGVRCAYRRRQLVAEGYTYDEAKATALEAFGVRPYSTAMAVQRKVHIRCLLRSMDRGVDRMQESLTRLKHWRDED